MVAETACRDCLPEYRRNGKKAALHAVFFKMIQNQHCFSTKLPKKRNKNKLKTGVLP